MSNRTWDRSPIVSIGGGTKDQQQQGGGGGVRSQLAGVLVKRPYGHQATTWSKRFFVIRDGYLMFYPESEKREFEKGRHFNIHPKGVIPLGGCDIEATMEGGQKYAIQISHPDLQNTLIIATDNSYAREVWVEALREGGRVTWSNQRICDDMIQHLETKGIELCREKTAFANRLEDETAALRDEVEKNEALERAAREMEEEKREIAGIMEGVQDEYDVVRRELDDTMLTMKTLEEERQAMFSINEHLQINLESLSKEKKRILRDLTDKEKVTRKLSKENQNLNKTSEDLRRSLQRIEERMREVRAEKTRTERSIRKNEEKRDILEVERRSCSESADDIMISLKQLIEDKELTELELKDEILARVEAEKRLRAAEASLRTLDYSIRDPASKMTRSAKNTMITNVKTLKIFFEELACEARKDGDESVIQSAIYSRKGLVCRAKSVRMATLRKSRCRTGDPKLFKLFWDNLDEEGEEREDERRCHSVSS